MRKALLSNRLCQGICRQGVVSSSKFKLFSSLTGPEQPVPDDYTVQGGSDTGNNSFRLRAAGKAMETYLREGRNYAKMMATERERYELGKRHLANIMGLNPDSITQSDVDRAIEYLFPSGLTDKKALPVMKPPEELFPKFEKLDFNEEGRPNDSLFYSLSPKFYRVLSDIASMTLRLSNEYYSFRKDAENKGESQELVLAGSSWLNKELMRNKIGEKINDDMYAHLILALNNLVSLPLAYKEKDFIFQFRQALTGTIGAVIFGPEVPTPEIDQITGRRTAKARTTVKRSTAHTVVTDNGSGKYTVNGVTLDSFRSLLTREIFYAPLIVTNLLGKVDVDAKIEGPGGSTVIPRAIRHGVALCIAALYPEHFEKLRIAGLLTRDPRRKERNKVNQPGARAKWIWKAR